MLMFDYRQELRFVAERHAAAERGRRAYACRQPMMTRMPPILKELAARLPRDASSDMICRHAARRCLRV